MTRTKPYQIWTERQVPADQVREWAGQVQFIEPTEDDFATHVRALAGADAVIAASRLRYDASLMAPAKHLAVISRTGAGFDNIDIGAATARGIAVCAVPDGPAVSTAEHAVMLILAVAKRVVEAQASLRTGSFDIFNSWQAVELRGRTLGLVGVGHIGSRVAIAASALGLQVLAHDPYVSPQRAREVGADLTSSVEELFGVSDILSLHVPLTPATTKLVNEERIALMRRGSILINTARGALVDEAALNAALESGQLAGAGLDVFDPEPPRPDNPLLHRIDVIATPHVAAATVASRERLWRVAIEQAVTVLKGDRPANLVNPAVLAHPADYQAEEL